MFAKKHLWLWLILLVAAIVRLVHAYALSQSVYDQINLRFDVADTSAFYQWAQTILAGDWLGRETYHPYFDWMRELGTREQWNAWWGSGLIFHQAPLYPYLLAGLLWLTSGSVQGVFLLQLLLGVSVVAVAYNIGRLTWDTTAGVIAAALAAVYVPFIFYAGTLLRDWLGPIIEPMILLFILLAVRTPYTSRRAMYWALAGGALGLAILLKNSAWAYAPAIGVAWLFHTYWQGRWRSCGMYAALILAGCLLVMSPAITRNAMVGAPLFQTSTRGIEELVEGNAHDAIPVGLYHPPSMVSVLKRAQGSRFAAASAILEDYEGNYSTLLTHQVHKVMYLFHPVDLPNNLSLVYVQDISPLLRVGLTYGPVCVLGLTGFLWMVLFSRRAWRREQIWLLLLFSAVAFSALLVGLVLGRFRTTLAMYWIIWAGIGMSWLIRPYVRALPHTLGETLRRSTKRLCITGMILLMSAGWVYGISPVVVGKMFQEPMWRYTFHPPEYQIGTLIYQGRGDYARAAEEIWRMRRYATQTGADVDPAHDVTAWEETQYRIRAARDFIYAQQFDDARDQLHWAAKSLAAGRPYGQLHFQIAQLYIEMDDKEPAKMHLKQFLEMEPDGFDAPIAQSQLEELE